MRQLRITQCPNPFMWYADKVGQLVPCLRICGDYLSREDSGRVNIVRKGDAEVVEPLEELARQAQELDMGY